MTTHPHQRLSRPTPWSLGSAGQKTDCLGGFFASSCLFFECKYMNSSFLPPFTAVYMTFDESLLTSAKPLKQNDPPYALLAPAAK